METKDMDRTLDKRDAIELCFILGLSLEDADSFVALVSEEGLHWRSPDELVYIFALKQGLDYAGARALEQELREYLLDVSPSTTPVAGGFTPVIRAEVSSLGTREELKDYLRDAASRLGTYHNNAYRLFMDMLEALEHPVVDEAEERAAIFAPEKLTLQDIVREYFYEDSVLRAHRKAHDGEDKRKLLSPEQQHVLSVIQKNVSEGWPDEAVLAKMKSRDTDVTRKTLILLFLATDSGPEEDMEAEPSREEPLKNCTSV